jgi:hypothetical protein
VEFELDEADRDLLLRDLEDDFVTMDDAYRKATGRTWSPYDEANDEGIRLLVRARDDLLQGPPWRLSAPRRDLELLFTRLRAGSSYALKIGGDSLEGKLTPLNVSDPDVTDERLDMIALADRLLSRLLRGDE